MIRELPRAVIRRTPGHPDWARLEPLSRFLLADGNGPALQRTEARLGHDGQTLHVRFDCEDRDIWGSYTERDDPLYEEEVVELFLAPGEEDPVLYFEIEVSPLGVLFDARIENPGPSRAQMRVLRDWDCPGIAWRAESDRRSNRWSAEIAIPWRSLCPRSAALPPMWRGNLYRIERTRGEAAELSCWSPTFTDPPDFHRPARFGFLEVET